MKLTPEQIDRLYQFTRQHYVEYYDLQTELVDHLANAIEQQWQENPKLTFEEILQKEFKKFGVFGFMDVVEKRQAALNRKYNGIIWNHFKAFFTIPKVILTTTLVGLTYFFLNISLYKADVVLIAFVIIILSFYFFIIYFGYKNKKANAATHKKWLLKEIILGRSSIVGMIYLPIQIMLHSEKVLENSLGILSISFLLVSLILIEYIMVVEIPKKAEAYLKETYPEYALENAN
jgi:predicted neutral ceramidase superfamily lipid hydrolase